MRCRIGDGTDDGAPASVVAARESQEVIERVLRRRDLAPRVRERLEMIEGVTTGQPLDEVARWNGRTERTVRRWLMAFAAGGATALAGAPRGGRPARVDGAYLAALERTVETPPRQLGLLFDAWTSPRLSACLAQTVGRMAPA